jgi:FkbM family methyltransferase
VIDVGAQTGCFSLLSKFCPNSRWYAFEAIQEAADILNNLLVANEIHNVSVYPIAVSNEPGFAALKLPSDSHWGLSTLGADPKRFNEYTTRSVECIDLDTFVEKEKINKVDFIKIDVEGWELFVLQGGKEMIKRDKPIILMEFNGKMT